MGFAMCGGMKLKHWTILNLPPGLLGLLVFLFVAMVVHSKPCTSAKSPSTSGVPKLFQSRCQPVKSNWMQLICVRWLHIMTMNLWTQWIHKLWPIYPPVPILSRKTSWVWYQDKRYTQMEVYPIKCHHKAWVLGWFWGTTLSIPRRSLRYWNLKSSIQGQP